MTVVINGEGREVSERATLNSLLIQLGLPEGRVALELNGDIVPRGRFGDILIREGDRIEIVQFVGGG